ncbi:MAG: class I tRNA ligase family protein [Candidatus Poseidoniia archaeon]|jgi:valyl-tRNA synthetase|nr:valine--tRNA ligase [Euryarchaeota archaeon]MDP6534141.1 class I tRNA ligase family protein [Candidatus Poseidoniia archaeon]MDP6835351.1 class I tRNA ligase family protein [Candidatus Poseidoniia archaeon]HIH79287.1 class I tRNA ligase family protein [Candidatus Poseidoniia archaeon]|tara:strand:+ start:548 stop:3040 length:2493 start_codon:yes stop_codon:yes gene_type:complete
MPEFRISEKRWSVDLEQRIQKEHYADDEVYQRRYGFDPASGRELFVIDTPPPYPSGTWHIGAVAHYSMIDVIARTQRLLGKDVKFPWGVDRNGINVEFTVEKKHGRKMRSWERGEFLDLCRETIESYTREMRHIARRVGLSCDFANEYQTDAADYRSVTQSIFVDLFRRGEIVEALRPNLYDPVEGTTIAEAEVMRLQRQAKLLDVRWSPTDGGDDVIISTTRPELICACGVVIVHPDDERYAHLVGSKLQLPLPVGDRLAEVEVRTRSSVDMEFGSGVLMVCSFGDQNDVAVFREMRLEPFPAISLDGCMTEVAGPLAGLPVAEARKRAIELLETDERIAASVERNQEIPVSERGKNPIEIILLKEWYVRQTHILERMRELADEINFVPLRNKQFLLDWMDGITIDWPVSRRRWYHTEIPVWYSADRTRVIVPPAGSYVQPWREAPPAGSTVLDRESRVELGSYETLAKELGELEGEEKVFDTWMDSSNSNLFVSGYLRDDELFAHSFPTTLRPQGKEIVRTWLYYTLLKSALLLDKPGFANVWIDGLGMDPWGRKMSKSLGNGIDAESVLECGAAGRTGAWKIRGPGGKQVTLRANKVGSECFRLWKACDAQVGDDFQINPEEIEAKYFGVLTKIFNVARFASQFPVPVMEQHPELAPEDRWLLAEFSAVLETVQHGYSAIDIFRSGQALKQFGTGLFPGHWLEMAKQRLYSGNASATWTLHRTLHDLLVMLSPICPFFCHFLSETLYGHSAVEKREFPMPPLTELAVNASEGDRLRGLTTALVEFNSATWKSKKDAGLSLAAEITGITVPDVLEEFNDALQAMHKLA